MSVKIFHSEILCRSSVFVKIELFSFRKSFGCLNIMDEIAVELSKQGSQSKNTFSLNLDSLFVLNNFKTDSDILGEAYKLSEQFYNKIHNILHSLIIIFSFLSIIVSAIHSSEIIPFTKTSI